MPPHKLPSLCSRCLVGASARARPAALISIRDAASHSIPLAIRSFSSTTPHQNRKVLTRAQQRRRQDRYVLAQHQSRVSANKSRQQELRVERTRAAGDPVKGITTPFVASFDRAQTTDVNDASLLSSLTSDKVYGAIRGDDFTEDTLAALEVRLKEVAEKEVLTEEQLETSNLLADTLATLRLGEGERNAHTSPSPNDSKVEPYLAHVLSAKAVARRLRKSFDQTLPLRLELSPLREVPEVVEFRIDGKHVSQTDRQRAIDENERISEMNMSRDLSNANTTQQHIAMHRNAALAIARIANLDCESAAGKRKVNIQRCIDEFGRHETDKRLAPKPLGLPAMPRNEKDPELWVKQKSAEALARQAAAGPQQRGGPDTGSSEVQVAVLTAKIRALSAALADTGRTDKAGKRNLRLLVHRRQKQLKYLWRKERGGPRWQHCIEKLGLTEGTWKGEITL